MRIVCLIRRSAPLYYFANKINQEHEVLEVIIEEPRRKKSNHSLLGKIKFFLIKLSRVLYTQRVESHNILIKWFGYDWENLNGSLSVMHVEDINSEQVVNRLKNLNPDILLVHGTSIVRKEVIEKSQLALNLHWGLSPYYRGTHCTDWALINWDIKNIGVTIHKLTADIDGGEILAQARAEIDAGDTLDSINMQLTYLGVELIIRAISKLKEGEDLKYYAQKPDQGYLTFLKQWSNLLTEQIVFIESNNLIAEMIKRPSRHVELPIVIMK